MFITRNDFLNHFLKYECGRQFIVAMSKPVSPQGLYETNCSKQSVFIVTHALSFVRK